MPKEHPAVRLERARASLKRLETKQRTLATLIKKRKASIRGLERSVAKVGPAPPPAAKEPRVRPKKQPDPLLDDLNAWGARAAKVLGVAVPDVRWTGTKGACKRAVRAHMHTSDSYRYERNAKGRMVTRNFRRGLCCVNRGYHVRRLEKDPDRPRTLMAHEVTHLVRKHGHGSAHGPIFRATMKRCLEGLEVSAAVVAAAVEHVEDDDAEGEAVAALREGLPPPSPEALAEMQRGVIEQFDRDFPTGALSS